MSVALWCDPGGHAFKGGVPGSQQFMGTVVGEDGHDTQVQVNVCPDHAFRSALDPTPELASSDTQD